MKNDLRTITTSITLPLEISKEIDLLANKERRSRNQQVVFMLEQALINRGLVTA